MDQFIDYLLESDESSLHFRDPQSGPLPSQERLEHARHVLSQSTQTLPLTGLGVQKVTKIITDVILPAIPNHSSNYYGFVTGGVTPAARIADYLAVWADTMVQVHLPEESIATDVEDVALKLLLDLLKLNRADWPGRIITTGATSSNVLALACARDWVVGGSGDSIAEYGFPLALKKSGIDSIEVLVCKSHSSLAKAAAIVGLGRQSVVQLYDESRPWDFDLEKLAHRLLFNSQNATKSIVCINFGEVNTGQYTSRLPEIRSLCDKYQAWLHVDGAFGVYLRALSDKPDSPYYEDCKRATAGLELVDSITGDSHKTLNVPYDSGVFFIKHKSILQNVFQNPGAVYLAGTSDDIPSPLNIGIENSRRFRALAVFSTLLSYGELSYCRFIERLITFSRRLSTWIQASSDYELLLESPNQSFTIVLFRAKDQELNSILKKRINEVNKIYVSGTVWDGQPAIRVAPCNWNIKDGDEELVIDILKKLI